MSDGVVPRLEDGSAPTTPAQLLARLDELGIDHTTVEHPPVFTVEEAKEKRGAIPGRHTKNLFLRNKKGRMWLVVCPEERPLDLKELGDRLGGGRLSFGSEDRLMRFLGVIAGAVTPLAVINDRGRKVTVVLDRELAGDETINCHPLDNAMTTTLKAADLVYFLEAEGHAPRILDL